MLFADDTVIYTANRVYSEAVKDLQESIDEFMIWTKSSKLTVSKCKTMSIEPSVRTKKAEADIAMCGVVLDEISVYKYLGVRLDHRLDFKTHTKGILKNISHKIYLLGKIKRYLTTKAAEMVYKATILPLMDVGDVFYSSTTKSLLNKLQCMQNRAIRIIHKLEPRSNTDKMHQNMRLLKLDDRRLLHTIQLARWAAEQDEYRDTRELSTRAHMQGRKNLKIYQPNNYRCQRACSFRAAKLWSQLPTILHSNLKKEEFKTKEVDCIVSRRINTD